MALFSLAIRTTVTTTVVGTAELLAGANNSFRLLECGITAAGATIVGYGLGISAAAGITPSTSGTPQAENTVDGMASNTTLNSAWATPPTAPSNYHRRASLAGAAGAGIVWTFQRGIWIAKSTGRYTLTNLGTNTSLCDCWFVIDE